MEKSKRVSETAAPISSRLKLGWLMLVTCTGLMLYSYFEYYNSVSFSTTVIFQHHRQTARDSTAESVSRLLSRPVISGALAGAKAADEFDNFSTANSVSTSDGRQLLGEGAAKVNKSSSLDFSLAPTAGSQNVFDHRTKERKSLDSEGSNEAEVDAFIREFVDDDENEENQNLTETGDYLLEVENERNESGSYFPMLNTTDPDLAYEISTGEFGVVYADHSTNDDAEPVEEEVEEEEEREEAEDVGSEENHQILPDADKIITRDKISPESKKFYRSHSATVKSAREIYRELLMDHILRDANHSNPHCSVPSLFHSWQNGIVTQIGQPLKRDCRKLRKGPSREKKKSKLNSQLKVWKSSSPWETFALRFKQMSCADIRQEFENNFYVSEMERNFPIAYTFVVYTNAGQVLRLLKSIYRPHNLYCIHPDARQGEGFKMFFKAIAKCLDNVFVVSKPVRVYYGHISITDAQLHCMRDLVSYPETRWRYVINLCGREIPIKTNREIVESLQKLKGHTALNLRHLTPTFWTQRFRFKFRLSRKGRIGLTRQRQTKPPKGVKLYKSMNFIAASRAFVQFLLSDPLSLRLHKYLSTVFAPEEHFYSSLYALPGARGARPPKGLLSKYDMPVVDAFIWINNRWQVQNRKKYCPGRRIVHGICILTAADMARIEAVGVNSRQPVFFFNKYFLEWDPIPMDCMEERLVQANMDEYRRDCLPTHRHTKRP